MQHVFWEALRAGIARAERDDSRRVARGAVYVLLVKPLCPKQRELCQWQREIALMAQGMKLLMHALRRTAYRRISTRPRCSAAAPLADRGAGRGRTVDR